MCFCSDAGEAKPFPLHIYGHHVATSFKVANQLKRDRIPGVGAGAMELTDAHSPVITAMKLQQIPLDPTLRARFQPNSL